MNECELDKEIKKYKTLLKTHLSSIETIKAKLWNLNAIKRIMWKIK